MKSINKIVLISLVVMLCVLAVWLAFISAENAREKKNHSIEVASRDAFVIDSLTAVMSADRLSVIDSMIDKSDSVIALKDATIKKQKKAISSSRIESQKYQELYEKTKTIALCDSTLKHKDELTAFQEYQIDTLSSQVVEYSDLALLYQSKVEIQNGVIEKSNEANIACQNYVQNLRKQLAKENNWWNRNKKWVYAAGGFAGGAALTKIIIN